MALTPPVTEIRVGSTWTDISSYVRDDLTITRGKRGEGQTAGPQTATFTINNVDGRFSPRNPTGPYYGDIGRNTPVRVSYAADSGYMDLGSSLSYYASCADSAGLSITGDIEIRVDVWMSNWRPYSGYKDFVTKSVGAGQQSYAFGLTALGYLQLGWSTTGSDSNTATSTLPVPYPTVGRRAVRVTFDVNPGTVKFYTADNMSGSWTQLGADVSTGSTSIYDSTSSLYAWTTGILSRYYALKVYQGIGGTERANPDFSAEADGTTSFSDSAGNSWSISTGQCVARDYRFYGEVSEWAGQWDHSGRDASVSVTASGVMRRMGQGGPQPRSAYHRGCTSIVAPVSGLVGYWPMEEEESGAVEFASGIAGGHPGHWSGSLTLASDSTAFVCSDALPKVTTAKCRFPVTYDGTGDIQVRVLMSVPSGGTTNGAVLIRLWCTGSVQQWDLVYGTGGSLTLIAYDVTGGSTSHGPIGFNLDGRSVRLNVSLSSAVSITYDMSTLEPGATTGGTSSGTNVGSVNAVVQVELNATGNATDVVFGHLTVQDEITSIFDLDDMLAAYDGEPASTRVYRIIAEEGLVPYCTGDDSGTPMGYQAQQDPLAIIRDCEVADGGILYEPRDRIGLAYRSGRGLFLQDSMVSLDYNGSEISDLSPTEDDQTLCNDMTASRTGGSSVRYVQPTGALSTQDPPNGVGVYDSSVSAGVSGDSQLLDLASWYVHLGTVNEPRYPHIKVNLSHPSIVANSALLLALTQIEVGDRITITFTDPPDWLPPDDVDQIVIGYGEQITSAVRVLTLVCVPESAYRVGIYGTAARDTRYQPSGTVTAGTMTTTSTSRTMTTPQLWTVTGGHFPIDIMIGGEQITVSSITGSSSPQTFNFSARSVNGVVKTHAAGEVVELYSPSFYAF